MNQMLMSINGAYVLVENRIYSSWEDKSYDVYDFGVDKWIDVLNENTIFSLKNNIHTLTELASYHRKITYQLMEGLNEKIKSNLMLEYEGKFGNLLLTEDIILLENVFKDAWNWTKDKVVKGIKYVGDKIYEFGGFAIQAGKDLVKCISGGGCSAFFEDYRKMLISPVGIAIETFLTATVIGDIGPIVIWGIMALWDGYLLLSGDPSFEWGNLIMDLLGMLFAPLVKGFKSLIGFFKGAKTIEGAVEIGLKNPETKGFFTTLLGGLKNGFNSVKGALQKAGTVMSDKLGLKWVGKAISSFTEQVAKILDSVGVKSTSKNIAKAGGSNVTALKQGLKSSAHTGTIAMGIEGGIHAGNEYVQGRTIKKNMETLRPIYDTDMDNLLKQLKTP